MTYEIVKQIGQYSDKTTTRESHLVRVDPTVCRQSQTLDLFEVDHVIVEALSIRDGGVEYQETHVVASDENGVIYPAILYQATRALTVEEALFSIGEHNYTETETETETQEDTDGH